MKLTVLYRCVHVEFDSDRSDTWYIAISDFLETHCEKADVESPGALVAALCRVLADAVEVIDADPRDKLEIVANLTAQAMGLRNPVVVIREPPSELN